MISKASIDLDGHEMELIIQELRKGADRARREGDRFRADLLVILAMKIEKEKARFHEESARFFLCGRKVIK